MLGQHKIISSKLLSGNPSRWMSTTIQCRCLGSYCWQPQVHNHVIIFGFHDIVIAPCNNLTFILFNYKVKRKAIHPQIRKKKVLIHEKRKLCRYITFIITFVTLFFVIIILFPKPNVYKHRNNSYQWHSKFILKVSLIWNSFHFVFFS